MSHSLQHNITIIQIMPVCVCLCVEDPGCEAPVTKILAAGADHHVFLQWDLPVHRRCQVDRSTNAKLSLLIVEMGS